MPPPQKDRCIAVMGFRSVGKSSLTIQFVENQFVDAYDPTIENTFEKMIKQGNREYKLNIVDTEGQDEYSIFPQSLTYTIHAFEKMIKLGNQEYKLKIVDTAGQDEYSIFPQSLTYTIHGYVLVYTVTSQKSFEVVKIIYEKLLDTTGNVNVPVILVGNKKDLHMERVISTAEGKELANSWNANFIESSAKQNESVVDIFKTLLQIIEKNDGGTQKKDDNCVLL